MTEFQKVFDEFEEQERAKARVAWMSQRAVQVQKPLTCEDLFWVAVLVFGLPLMVWLGGGHIGG